MPIGSSDPFLIWLLALPLIISLGFLGWAIYDRNLETRLKSTGILVQGEILSVGKDSHVGNSYFYVIYQYRGEPTQPDLLIQRQAVSQAHHAQLQPGQEITVNFLAGNPDRSRLAGLDRDESTQQMALRRAGLVFVIWLILLGVALLQG
jgi:Protein of unknown function (DUF3592)